MMDNIFKDKVALVTGGSFGIGRATAIAFAKKGAKVVIADWVDDCETYEIIKEAGGDALFVECDVSKVNDVKSLIKKTIQKYGRLDFAYNNAGIEGPTANVDQCLEENWDKLMDINLKGVWQCMKYQIPEILRNGKGAIVNCASVAGLVGFPGLPVYVASKHGVIGLTKTAALEYAKKGIRINVICPGAIKTPMMDRFTGKDKSVEKQFENMEPIGRLGEPEEVANAVLWLCSDEASYITGHTMAVDGGWAAQ